MSSGLPCEQNLDAFLAPDTSENLVVILNLFVAFHGDICCNDLNESVCASRPL